jgi:anti-sigma B factor antagonist
MDKALTIRVRRGPGHTILTAAGEVDIATVARFRARLFALAGEGRPVIADLDQVSFIDASGLGALVGAARRAAAHGTSLHVVCARAQTRQLFHLTGLDRQLHLARTLTEALQALTAPGTPTGELPQPANTTVWQFSTCPVIPACCRATPTVLVPFFSSAVSSSTTIASGSPRCARMNRCSARSAALQSQACSASSACIRRGEACPASSASCQHDLRSPRSASSAPT